jgi:hypothetical protein
VSRPSNRQIEDWFAELRSTPWRGLEEALKAALEADKRGGVARPDGYPTSTAPGSGGGSELTSVEAAAEFLCFSKREADEHRALLEQAVGYAQQLLFSMRAMRRHLDGIARLTNPTDLNPPKSCEWCKEAGITRDWDHRTNLDGLLPRETHLCGAHYNYAYKRGEKPSAEQTQHHDKTGTWRVRVVSDRKRRAS